MSARGRFGIDGRLPGELILQIFEEPGKIAALILALPVLQILVAASPTHVEKPTGPDEHVGGGHDIYERRFARIFTRHPDIEGNIVRGPSIDDRKEAVETQQELGTAVVKGWIAESDLGQDQSGPWTCAL